MSPVEKQVGTLLEKLEVRWRVQTGGSQLQEGTHRLQKSLFHSVGSRKERKTMEWLRSLTVKRSSGAWLRTDQLVSDGAELQYSFPPHHMFLMALDDLTLVLTRKIVVPKMPSFPCTLLNPLPLPAPHTASQGRAHRLSFLPRLWGMGLLCMSEPLKAQPSDVLIFVLTFPALGALA